MYFLESGESVHSQNKCTNDAVIEFRNKKISCSDWGDNLVNILQSGVPLFWLKYHFLLFHHDKNLMRHHHGKHLITYLQILVDVSMRGICFESIIYILRNH